MRTFTAILSCAAIAAVNADAHISTMGPFNVTIDANAAPGTPMSWNPVGGDYAVKHEPAIVLSHASSAMLGILSYPGDGKHSFSVYVRGGDPDDLTNLHPQTYGDGGTDAGHHITSVWVEDQNGVVVCSHEFVDDATPLAVCNEGIIDVALTADPDATFTAYEHCNLHGTWQGPTTYLAMTRDVQDVFNIYINSNTAVFPKNATLAPVKHEPAFVSEGDGDFTIKVLGTGGEGLHPQDAPTHFIEATWAVDGHGTVVAFSSVDKESTAQSSAFKFPYGFTGIVTPWEHCNLHGIWEGASFVVETAWQDDSTTPAPIDTNTKTNTTTIEASGAAAFTTTMGVAALACIAAAMW